MSVPRLGGAFYDVDVAINHLEVWQAPIIEQRRPRRVAVFVPHPKQRDAVVNLGAFLQPPAGLTAAARLHPSIV